MEQNLQKDNKEISKCGITSIADAIQTQNKVRNLDETQIRIALVNIYKIIGLRNFPTPTEDSVLMSLIRDKYSGYTTDEFVLAFTMAVSRELSEDLNIDHYQMFSPEYFGRIMSAYRAHRTETLKKLNQQKSEYVQPTTTQSEYYTKVLIEPFEKFIETGTYPYSHLDGWMLYDRLYKIMKVPEEKRNEYKEMAIKMMPDKRRTAFERPESPEEIQRKVVKIAKHLAFKDWITQKAKEKFNLREFINQKINQYEISQLNQSKGQRT